jgi:hypothetical protein
MKGLKMKKQKWELKMHEARELRKQGAGLLFDRVSLLVACYNDDDFRAWHAESGTDEVEFLDEELSDTDNGFLAWKGLFESYPNREDWVKHNVRELIAMQLKAQADDRRKEREGDPNKTKWKERALAAEAECERLRSENAGLKQSLEIVAAAKCS